jgi:class 3 adenylate cyclase
LPREVVEIVPIVRVQDLPCDALERRVFLFIDIEGSTTLAERLGDLAFVGSLLSGRCRGSRW